MALKIGDVWEKTWAFARVEAALWWPIAFLCWGLPALLPDTWMPNVSAMMKGEFSPAALFGQLASGALQLLGQLALAALVLQPGRTVADALRTAVRRYGAALVTVLAIGLCLLVCLLLVALALASLHGVAIAPAGAATLDPRVAPLLLLLVIPLLVVFIRLTTLWPSHISRGTGGWRTIAAAWRETGPVVWRLALLTLAYFLTLDLLLVAVNAGLGTLAKLVGLLVGTSAPGDAVVTLVEAALLATGSGIWALFAAQLHRQLMPEPLSQVFE